MDGQRKQLGGANKEVYLEVQILDLRIAFTVLAASGVFTQLAARESQQAQPQGHIRQGQIIDLNTVVLSGTAVTLIVSTGINDRGGILATGVLPNGDLRSVLLIPCANDSNKDAGCRE